MDDKVIQIEVALNFLNTLLAKAVYFKDVKVMDELSKLRHNIYYGDVFDYEIVLKKLKDMQENLSQYDEKDKPKDSGFKLPME